MRLVVVSGLSGSGKTIALHTLEDEGFYCIDNLHLGLLKAFVGLLISPGLKAYDQVAVGIDARSGVEELQRLPRYMDEIRDSGLDSRILFLQADTDTLLKRYSETRRRHPLTRPGLPLMEAIEQERSVLAGIAARADLIVDTTRTNLHQLRALIRERMGARGTGGLSLLFQSFGYKHGVPTDSDFVFDVRCLPNPHWQPHLRALTGTDPEVMRFLEGHAQVQTLFDAIRGFLEAWIPQFQVENRRYLTVSLGCTGGQHRSVYLVERLVTHFRNNADMTVSARHRELA